MAYTAEKLADGVVKYTVTASDTINLKDANGRQVGRWVIQLDGGGTSSTVPQGVIHGSGIAASGAEDLAYINRSTGLLVDPGITPITVDGIYDVIADGCDVVLDVTYTSDTVEIYAKAIAG